MFNDIPNRFANAEREDIAYWLIFYFAAIFLALTILLPYLYVLSVSLRPSSELFGAIHWIPKTFDPNNYVEAVNSYSRNLINSFVIAFGTVVLSLLITIPGAYVFARKQFPGRKFGFYFIIVSLMFPYILLIIPISDLWRDLGLYDTIPGLWIAYQAFVTPFAIWILRDYFEDLPLNLEEAAQVYGLTQFSAFIRVILPISRPAIVAVGFLSFLVGWNDFLFSNMLTTEVGPRPAVVQLFLDIFGSEGYSDWTTLTAKTIVIGAPPAVLYLYARRRLSEAFAVSG